MTRSPDVDLIIKLEFLQCIMHNLFHLITKRRTKLIRFIHPVAVFFLFSKWQKLYLHSRVSIAIVSMLAFDHSGALPHKGWMHMLVELWVVVTGVFFLLLTHNKVISSLLIRWTTLPPPITVIMVSVLHLQLFWWSLTAPALLSASKQAFPLALRSVCDVGEVLCVSAAGSHTCSLVPAPIAAQLQSPSLITQSLKNKETGNVNQPALQLQRCSTPLCNKHYSN